MPGETRSDPVRLAAPPRRRRRRRSAATQYGTKTMATAKALGISPWEASCWNVEFRHDELVEHHRPAASIMPIGVRRLAYEMLELVRSDLRRRDLKDWRYRLSAKDYRPDPDGAQKYVDDPRDRVLGFVWCCQVLKINEDAARQYLLGAPLRAVVPAPRDADAELPSVLPEIPGAA
jgi:hypothetical protein